MSLNSAAVQRRLVLVMVAAVIAAMVLVALPALLSSEPSLGVTSDAEAPSLGEAGGQEQNAPLPANAVAPAELPGDLRAFAVTDLPAGFRVDRNEFQDQPDTRADRVYMTFVRGEDPETSADWAIIRLRVLYSPFDANAWYNAYMKPDPAEESGRIPNVELTSVGENTNALIEYPQPGQDAGLVLRFGDNGVQVMLTATPGVTVAELRQVAEGIVEVPR